MSTPGEQVHLPSVRQLWKTRDGDGATTILALCDEVERLRLELDRARRGEEYRERDAEILREEYWQMRRDVARAIGVAR